MSTSSLSGKPDDYESRKSWTNKDWYTHVGAWENQHGQICFGSSIAFCAMMQQFHRTHTQHIPDLLEALQAARSLWGDYLPPGNSNAMKAMKMVDAAIARAKGEA